MADPDLESFNDLFADVLGAPNEDGAVRSSDLRMTFDVLRSEATEGARREIEVARSIACRGDGAAPTDRVECTPCEGRGVRVVSKGQFQITHSCKACDGRGHQVRTPCDACRGHGNTTSLERLTLTIPAGIDEGQILRLVGKGNAEGSEPEHLYVEIAIPADRVEGAPGESSLGRLFARAVGVAVLILAVARVSSR